MSQNQTDTAVAPTGQRDVPELRKELAELFADYQPALDRYQWPIESLRWNELVYCVLESIGPELGARSAARALLQLDLVDVNRLAGVQTLANDDDARRGELIVAILRETGFGDSPARTAVATLARLADQVHREWGDRVQRLLRRASASFVDDVVGQLDDLPCGADATRHAVTRWVQNVLNMPVYLDTEAMRALCTHLGAKPTDLVAAADDLDMNMAILDDVAHMWFKAESETTAQATNLVSPVLADQRDLGEAR